MFVRIARDHVFRGLPWGGRLLFDRKPLQGSGFLPQPTFLPRGITEDFERIALLKTKVDEARTPTDRSLYQRRGQKVERMNCDGDLLCLKCNTFKTIESFYVNLARKCGLSSQCKVCIIDRIRHYFGCTLRGTMMLLLNNAKSGATHRSNTSSRHEAGRFEIDIHFLLNLWLKQEGRCAYSGIIMNVATHQHWRLSLERKDNNLGYIPHNVVFICAELNTPDFSVTAKHDVNGSSQWSKQKTKQLPRIAFSSIPLDALQLQAMVSSTKIKKKKGKSGSKKRSIENGDLLCSACGQFKSTEDFYACHSSSRSRMYACKTCALQCRREYGKSFGGFLRSRLHSAKHWAEKRTISGRPIAGEFNLTIDNVLALYVQQQGLCFYSGVKMTLQSCSDWMCSIERLDNAKGYVVGNVALICAEFQTSDRSLKAKGPVEGTSQWSKTKASHLIEWLRNTR
eukprot:GEMP01031978.1.p1 GENE.GEMP01031978.1~~GEMP01031978.1.p1  ORF type:complete len:453 (+),score=38.49 GEMP01031978.1:188-1546(+)